MLKKFFIFLIKAYQVMGSPFVGNECRFTPSGSEYSIESIRKHGIIKGLWLTLKMLLKCHPYHKGGNDPVP
jgi:uncharacterized protein